MKGWKRVKEITRHFNLNWNVNIQMKINELGEPIVYEINPRIAGTIIMTKYAGANLIEHGVLKTLGIDSILNKPKDRVKMFRYLKAVFNEE